MVKDIVESDKKGFFGVRLAVWLLRCCTGNMQYRVEDIA